jgi:hypothetical protein
MRVYMQLCIAYQTMKMTKLSCREENMDPGT